MGIRDLLASTIHSIHARWMLGKAHAINSVFPTLHSQILRMVFLLSTAIDLGNDTGQNKVGEKLDLFS